MGSEVPGLNTGGKEKGDGQMVLWLQALAPLTEGPGLVPSTHMKGS